jgi:hypothetical protein
MLEIERQCHDDSTVAECRLVPFCFGRPWCVNTLKRDQRFWQRFEIVTRGVLKAQWFADKVTEQIRAIHDYEPNPTTAKRRRKHGH